MTCPITADRDAWRGAVTDADRDLAARWASGAYLGSLGICENDIRRGLADDISIVQAFARHRLAAEASFKAREDALAELLEIALDEYETRNGRTKSLPHWSHTARNVLLARAHTATDAGGE